MQHEKLIELREARTAWHEKFGVIISNEYARFLRAVSAIEDSYQEDEIDPRLSIAIKALKDIKEMPQSTVRITGRDVASKALDEIIFIRVAQPPESK
jgi:hypothetical protein